MLQRLLSPVSQLARSLSRYGNARAKGARASSRALLFGGKILSTPVLITQNLGTSGRSFSTQNTLSELEATQRDVTHGTSTPATFTSDIQEFLAVDPKVSQEIDGQLLRIKDVIAQSKDLELQKQIIHPLLAQPLPLSNEGTGWRTFYFNDAKSSALYTSLSSMVERNNRLPDQDNYLIAVVEYSGAGKTHLALTYSRNEGCLPIIFSSGCHSIILKMAEDFITSLYPSEQTWKDKGVLSFEEEKLFLVQSKQAIQLIPITFIQFAGIYFQKVPPAAATNFDGLVRAIVNGCVSSIKTMYAENLRRYAKLDEAEFEEIFQTAVTVAKKCHIKAIFYDEIAVCANYMQGRFVHYGEAIPQDQRMLQLQAECEKGSGLVPPVEASDVYRKCTSLLYLLNIAMEEFSRAKISQILATTDYSSIHLHVHDAYCRERLQMKYLVCHEAPSVRLKRFKEVFTQAFGLQMETEMNKQDVKEKLEKLASRAVYLFGPIQQIDYTGTELSGFMQQYVKMAEESAKSQAQRYVTQALSHPLYQGTLLCVLAELCLGAKELELSPWVLEQCVKSGIVHLPENCAIETPPDKVSTSTDPYLREYLQQFKTVDKLLGSLILNGHQQAEQGQYLTALMMKAGSENPKAMISQIFSVAAFDVSKTIANSFSLRPQRATKRASELHQEEDYNIMALSKQPDSEFLRSIYLPSIAFCPDGIVPLVDNGKSAGFLVYKCKHHSTNISWQFFVKEALDSTQPLCFYSGASKKYQQWVETYNELNQESPLVWIRVVYACGFSPEVWEKVQAYNKSPAGIASPIILITPATLFKNVENNDKLKSVSPIPTVIHPVSLTANELFVLSLQTPGATWAESLQKLKELANKIKEVFPGRKTKDATAGVKQDQSEKPKKKRIVHKGKK